MQNEGIRFCLRLDKVYHISEDNFRCIIWLSTSMYKHYYIPICQELSSVLSEGNFWICPALQNRYKKWICKIENSFLQDKHGTESYSIRWFVSMEQLNSWNLN